MSTCGYGGGLSRFPARCLSYQPLRSARNCRCIRIKTNRICARQLFLFLWALPAIFQFGGLKRNDPLKRLLLEHGDVVVWGGESRLFYHGIQPLKAGFHPLTTDCRYNLTFRQAGKKNKNKNYYCCAREDV